MRRSHLLVPLTFACLAAAGPSSAATRTWPGAAPCNGTLQACIDASGAGDEVLVAATTPIDEAITIGKSFALRAAPNRLARFAEGRGVASSVNGGPLAIELERLHLTDGAINIQHGAPSTLSVRLVDNRLDSTGAAGSRIRVVKSNANGAATLDVSGNRVRMGSGAEPGLLLSVNAPTTGRVAFNRVDAVGQRTGSALKVSLSPGAAHAVNVFNNRVEGGFAEGGIRLLVGEAPNFGSGGGATPVIRAFGNALRCVAAPGAFPNGLYAASLAGSGGNELRLFNNTAVGCDTPIWVDYPVNGPNWSGSVFNNLIAGNSSSLVVSGNVVAGFAIERNLSFGNAVDTMPPSATLTVTGDPRLRGLRPGAGSAAINAGNAVSAQLLFGAAGAPQVDADGRRRTIGSGATAVDIGAYEAGDTVVRARVGSAASSALEVGVASDTINVQLGKAFNPLAGQAGVANPRPVGVFHALQWFAYGIGGELPAGAGVFGFAPGPQGTLGATFRHETTSGNTAFGVTSLSNAYLNGQGQDEAIVLATPVWLGGPQNTGNLVVAYNCPPGSTGAGCWLIANQAADVEVPTGFAFHVYAQDPSPNAFVHRVAGSGTFSPMAGHAILGDDPDRCASALATPRMPFGSTTRNDTTFQLEWRQIDGRGVWGIRAEQSMPAGAEFFVFVDAAAYEDCAFPTLFADGFEG